MNSYLQGYELHRGDFDVKTNGSLVASANGTATAFALFKLEPRGELFVGPGAKIYEGMIVGKNSRGKDMDLNPTRAKHLTNHRASGADDALVLAPVTDMSLEKAIAFISDDELIEATPNIIRMRKRHLNPSMRKNKK